jgi:flavorubredoxin
VIDSITNRVMKNIEVISPTEYRFKQRIIENGIDETLEGKRRYASNIDAIGYNIYPQSGLMAYIGRPDLQEDVNPSVGQFVNKMIGIVTGYSTIEGKEGWDKDYVDAINTWLAKQNLPPVSEENPLYFDYERCSYTFVGSTHKEKPHIYQDSFTE